MRKYETLIRELLLVIGFFLFCYGLWLIHPPIMFVISGAMLIWVGLPSKTTVKGGGD